MNKKITFKELANLSNVSLGTLSRYFNQGPVSEEKHDVISANIKKYKFVRNSAAAKMRGKSDEVIILRTVVVSSSLDNIIAGIIETIDGSVSVRYPGETEVKIIKGIQRALSDKPRYLIVFAPIDSTFKLNHVIEEAKAYTKIVTFNFKASSCSSIRVNYKKAFNDLSKIYQELNYVYDNKGDLETYVERINKLKASKIKVISNKANSKTKANFFQSEKLYNKLGRRKKTISLVISYRQPIDYNDNVEWIFVDYFFVGVQISRLCSLDKKQHPAVEAKLVK